MANDPRVTQMPRVTVVIDPAAPLDVTQMARITVGTISAPIEVSQMARIAVMRDFPPVRATQMVRVLITKDFVTASNDSCRVYVVT